jgi:hypothetical protein
METQDYIPANGETVLFINLGVSSSAIPDTLVCIIWDPDGDNEIIVSSYGEVYQTNVEVQKVGDGVKKVRICLQNDLTEPAYLGAFWQGTTI